MAERKEIIRGIVNTEVVADKTVREVERIDAAIQQEIVRRGGAAAIRAGLSESIGIPQQVAIAAMYVWRQIRRFRYTADGEKLTIRRLYDIADDARGRFIQQHIVNYAAYYVIQEFYDWLTDKKLIARFSKTEGYWRKIDREFKEYEQAAVGHNEQVSKMLFMDLVTQTFGNVEPLIETLEVAIRDYLIVHRPYMVRAGQKDDIATLQKVVVCMYFLALTQQHFHEFFFEIVKEHGVDFSIEFRYADLQKMTLNFIFMCQSQGIRFCNVGEKEKDLLGVEVEKSVRVNAAWNTIVGMLTDDDLTDQTAARVIGMNQQASEDYQHVFAETEARREELKRQEMEQGFKELEEKYKVTKEK